MPDVRYTTVLSCPECGHRVEARMPENACRYFYRCEACGAMLKPLPGDCCVFCSYGDVPCPPVQMRGSACDRGSPGGPGENLPTGTRR